jgi:CubicO group peptidase (beta-lactamase class C family)
MNLRASTSRLSLGLLSFCAAFNVHAAISPEWDWATASPESQGMIASQLESVWTDLEGRRTTAFLVIRNDKMVFERFAIGQGGTTKHYTASMAKALVGGVSVAVALSDGRIALDDAASKYVAQWADDPAKTKITIRQLGSHSSGLADAEETGLAHDKMTGWKGDFWKRLAPPNDPFTISRDKTPLLFTPGDGFQYSNPGMAMLGYAVTAALKDGKDLRSLLRERVMRPIGVPESQWSIGYEQTFHVDGLPLIATWGGGSFTPRATARVGRLMLGKGNWEGQQLIASSAVEQTTTDAGTLGNGAIGWWSNHDGTSAKLPKDAFWGAGAGHQVLLVVPSLRLIAVRNGESLSAARNFAAALQEYFFHPLMNAVAPLAAPVAGPAPYPPSPVIQGVTWSPKETIIRRANGSDNWPLTWADDDHLYTAYGDGNGFDPFVSEKLSLGLAKIIGAPPEFKGVNVRASALEHKGEGKSGKKASGLLMVDGVLYLWARNAANAQLAWSSDHGTSWTWSDWKFTNSFGCPAFVNFGRNYAGARDQFVYVCSPDADSAYEPADRMVLARVPNDQIRNRQSYEFFQRLDATGQPVWTRDITARGAVFSHPGKCYRSSMSYNVGLRRYLWCQTLPGGDARFRGGFAIYDAAEPWGPWTTVSYFDEWDAGPGESSSLPTKWMSADGQTVYLVFSGEDCFSVRKATFIPHGSPTPEHTR